MKAGKHVLRRATLFVALGFGLATTAHAQSNITGSIFGQASSEAGTTVTVENVDTGQRRSVAVDSSGRYRVSSLPNGNYRVLLQRDGADVSVREDVVVTIAGGTEVSFLSQQPGVQNLDRIEVTATSVPSIDVSQVDTRTVFTAEQLNRISIPRDIASAALLAPGVVRNDSYTSNGNTVPSFGGSASSENAYYINGYAVTNPLTSIGFSTLPFDAIAQQQILTGGYGAEFGRSTGGVINVVTKRGTNEWGGGVYSIWQPEVTRASPRNRNYPDTGFYPSDNVDPSRRTDGTLYTYRNKNQYWENTTGAYVSGPIVKDRLFIYADAELTRRDGAGVSTTRTALATTPGAWQEYRYDYPRWAAKVDWNITDDHVLEFTGISDVTKYSYDGYTFNYGDYSSGDVKNAGTEDEDKSKLYIGKYTGYLTDNLTVSVLYGEQKITHDSNPFGLDQTCPYVSAAGTARVPSIPSANYNGCWSTSTVDVDGSFDQTKGGRFDVEYRIGDHDFRIGYDRQDAESFTGSAYQGGFVWVYSRTANPNTAINPGLGVGAPGGAGGFGPQGYYVRQQYYTQLANVETKQEAQFIEDRWQVSDNLLLSLGLRNEQFTNLNGDGIAYISQRHQLAPRLGAVWDLAGDSTTKLFANAGRYHLALPNNVAVRAASNSLYTQEYFTYTGVDPRTGAPTGLNNIPVTDLGYSCPGNVNAVSANLECGQAADPRTVAAKDIKSHYQDEFIVGMEQQLNPAFSWGAKATYRNLRSAIDDTCTGALNGGCFLFNPGEDNTFFQEQEDGSLLPVRYTAEELALPRLKRKYLALDLFAEHPLSNGWYGKLEYTWSRNFGNTEGQLASDLDIGSGGQTDVSVTQDWDLPQLMDGANGLLPNNRTHQIKAFGFFELSEEWSTGGSMIVASGRPRNCTSFYPSNDPGLYNGSYYYFCGLAGSGTTPGTPGYIPPSADYGPSPRGSYGETPWTFNLNLNVSYRPAWAEGLTLQADVINALNRQVAGSYNQQYSADRSTANQLFGQELNYSSPRYLRLTARYDF